MSGGGEQDQFESLAVRKRNKKTFRGRELTGVPKTRGRCGRCAQAIVQHPPEVPQATIVTRHEHPGHPGLRSQCHAEYEDSHNVKKGEWISGESQQERRLGQDLLLRLTTSRLAPSIALGPIREIPGVYQFGRGLLYRDEKAQARLSGSAQPDIE